MTLCVYEHSLHVHLVTYRKDLVVVLATKAVALVTHAIHDLARVLLKVTVLLVALYSASLPISGSG